MVSDEKRKVCWTKAQARTRLISSRGSSLRIAFSAIYRSASVWFEGNFAFLSTVSANRLMHFSSLHSAYSTPYVFSAKAAFCTVLIAGTFVLNLSVTWACSRTQCQDDTPSRGFRPVDNALKGTDHVSSSMCVLVNAFMPLKSGSSP
jgi:hypothetical protein